MPENASIGEIDFRTSRGISKQQIAALGGCEWSRRQQNLIVIGATGVAKTWLGCAFGTQACRLGMTTSFYRESDLWSDIASAELDGSLAVLKAGLIKPRLLILDDMGIGEMSPLAERVFLDVVERRMRTGSLVITSQYPTDKWHDSFLNKTIADAVLDRVAHQSHRFVLKGESMRKLRAQPLFSDC